VELVGAVEHDLTLLADGLGVAVVDVEGVWSPIPEGRCSRLFQSMSVSQGWTDAVTPTLPPDQRRSA
jgi:hypothetical protein